MSGRATGCAVRTFVFLSSCTGFDAPTVSVFPSGEEVGHVGPDRVALSQNSGRRTTGVQEVRSKRSSAGPSNFSDVAFQISATASNSSPDIVTKTHVSDVFRLVFAVGIEGSGHHYIWGTSEFLFGGETGLPRRGGDHSTDFEKYYAPVMMGGETKTFTTTSLEAMEDMRHIAEWAATLSSPGGLEFLFFPRFCSYPLNPGPLKVMQYIDLRRVAENAEGEGIDLRVVYLRRSAKDIVITNTVHRSFHLRMGHKEGTRSEEELFVEYMRVLFTDIAVVHSFLSEIGSEFIVCHDWDRLGSTEQASRIANFISPNEEIVGLVESVLVQTARNLSNTDALPFEDADALVSRLQRKLDAYEPIYCG
ncbi:unnamed protein product [Ectocarpus fasciculatus]